MDPKTGEHRTLSDALARGLINPRTNRFNVGGESIRMTHALDEEYITAELAARLNSSSGVSASDGSRMSVMELLASGLFDPDTGHIIDPVTQKSISLEDAVASRFISSSDARQLMELTCPAVSVTTVTSEIKICDSASLPTKVMSAVDAVRAGLINEENNEFTDMVTGRKMTIEEAVENGYIRLVDGNDKSDDVFDDEFEDRRNSSDGGESMSMSGNNLPVGENKLPVGGNNLPVGGNNLPVGGISRLPGRFDHPPQQGIPYEGAKYNDRETTQKKLSDIENSIGTENGLMLRTDKTRADSSLDSLKRGNANDSLDRNKVDDVDSSLRRTAATELLISQERSTLSANEGEIVSKFTDGNKQVSN